MVRKKTEAKTPRPSQSHHPAAPLLSAVEPVEIQPEPTNQGSGNHLFVWLLVILAVGFLFKDKLGCKPFNVSIPVQMVKEVHVDSIKGGPYNITSICSIGKDRVAFSDEVHNKVVVLGLNGVFESAFGKKSTARGEIHHVSGICSDGDGNIYVLDTETADVFGFNVNGKKFLQVDSNVTGYFYGPRGLCYAKGNFAIADTGSCRIVTMDPSGKTVKKWGQRGKGPTQLISPTAVLVDAQGRYITLDCENKRIKIQDEKGSNIKIIVFKDLPIAMALDGANHLFVSFSNGQFIKEYTADSGRYMGDLVVKNPVKDGSYKNVSSLCVVDGNKIVAADSNGFRVYQLAQ